MKSLALQEMYSKRAFSVKVIGSLKKYIFKVTGPIFHKDKRICCYV